MCGEVRGREGRRGERKCSEVRGDDFGEERGGKVGLSELRGGDGNEARLVDYVGVVWPFDTFRSFWRGQLT